MIKLSYIILVPAGFIVNGIIGLRLHSYISSYIVPYEFIVAGFLTAITTYFLSFYLINKNQSKLAAIRGGIVFLTSVLLFYLLLKVNLSLRIR